MNELTYPGIVNGLALLVYYSILYKSGVARGKYDVLAPSHDGPDLCDYLFCGEPALGRGYRHLLADWSLALGAGLRSVARQAHARVADQHAADICAGAWVDRGICLEPVVTNWQSWFFVRTVIEVWHSILPGPSDKNHAAGHTSPAGHASSDPASQKMSRISPRRIQPVTPPRIHR